MEQPGTTCRFFRHVLELEDSIEILVKANFVAEGAAGPATFAVLADGAEARGDLLSAVTIARGCATRPGTSATRARSSEP